MPAPALTLASLALASLVALGGVGLELDPRTLAPAELVPGQVPEAVVVRVEPTSSGHLRGDFEAPDRVLVAFADPWPATLAELGAEILDSGAVLTIVREAGSSRAGLDRLVAELGRRVPGGTIELEPSLVDTPWVRDWGPLQIGGAAPRWLDANVEGTERDRDDVAPAWLADRHQVELRPLDWALDGGAFISNGAGLCVLTLEYLADRRIGAEAGELVGLLGAIGCRATALVPTLIDEQTKHADMIAQFVGPNRLMIAELDDGLDGASEDGLRLEAARRGILRAAAALGEELTVVAVPTPAAQPGQNPRSYVNGLRLGDRYLMPSYPQLGRGHEQAARAAVERAQDPVPVVTIDASALIAAGGALHCASLGLFTR